MRVRSERFEEDVVKLAKRVLTPDEMEAASTSFAIGDRVVGGVLGRLEAGVYRGTVGDAHQIELSGGCRDVYVWVKSARTLDGVWRAIQRKMETRCL